MVKIHSADQQLIDVRRMRRVATLLLLVMACIYGCLMLVPHSGVLWLEALSAFSEAAMIGALADWFAVTAIFRHPMGLPIPHTAIVKRNQGRIAENLGTFIEQNFIQGAAFEKGLEETNPTAALGQWLQADSATTLVGERILTVMPLILKALDNRHIAELAERQVFGFLEGVDIAPYLADGLEVLSMDSTQNILLDEGLLVLGSFVENNNYWLFQRLNEVAPWFIPSFVSERLAAVIIERGIQLIEAVRSDPQHELRGKFALALSGTINGLRKEPEYKERCRVLKNAMLRSESFKISIQDLTHALIRRVLKDFDGSHDELLAKVKQGCRDFGELLCSDPSLQETGNKVIREIAVALVGSRSGAVAEAIADIVKSWDSRTLSEKLELQVGRDLQFIRINGTLVGGAVGLGLFMLGLLIRAV